MWSLVVFVLVSIPGVRADGVFAGGRVMEKGVYVELFGGLGRLDSVSGSVTETRNGAGVSGGLNADLNDLGVSDGSETVMFGGRIIGKWFTLLFDYRDSSLESSGTADTEVRVSVDGLSFNGQQYDYLLIPASTDYTLDAESTWLGGGLRFTPFTVNPRGRVTFTPWLHVGIQYVDSSFDLDSGDTVRVEVPGFGERTYAVQGRASGEAELLIPEYGIGGELRFRFHAEGEPGPELVGYGTYKILQYEGPLDSIGIDDDEFDRVDIDYTALVLGLDLLIPLGDRVSLMAGLYAEQVDATVELDAKPSEGDYQRVGEGDYTLYGFRAGVRF